MIEPIPFLRPQVPRLAEYAKHLEQMDESRLYSNYGPLNAEFEARLTAEMFGGDGACVTVNNATSGLALATRMMARSTGRYVVMPSFTFAATPLAARWAGYEPYFVDVDPLTWMTSESAVRRVVDELGDDVAAVMPYATFGNNLDLGYYAALQTEGVPVIVDAAASLGSRVDGAHFGQGFPGAVVFSMHATKPFSVGEAGVIHSGDAALAARLRRAGNFGFDGSRAAVDDGFNTKMPEMTAAVALATLDAFDTRMRGRAEIHAAYRDAFARHDTAGEWSFQAHVGQVVHQFFPALAPVGVSGDAIVSGLEKRGIQARRYFAPACHEQPVFVPCLHGDLPSTDDLTSRVVSLPLWDGLDTDNVDRIVGAAVTAARERARQA